MQLSAIDGIIKIHKIVYCHVDGMFMQLKHKIEQINIIQKFQFKIGRDFGILFKEDIHVKIPNIYKNIFMPKDVNINYLHYLVM